MTEPKLFTATPTPDEDVTTTLYRAAIGPVSTGYYLPIFTRFEAADHAGLSWNTAASLLTLNWLVFRKLWVAALAYVGILVAVALLVFGIGHVVLQFSDTLMMILGLGFGLIAFVLPGLFGNALFHTECRKAMSKALVGHATVADARDALLSQASTRRRAMWLAVANVACLLIGFAIYTQVAAFSSVAVLPQGALDAGQVSVGRRVDGPIATVNSAPTMAAASTAMPAASMPLDAASATASVASSSPSTPVAPASVATPDASAPHAAASELQPEPTTPKLDTALPVATVVESKAKTKAKKLPVAPKPSAKAEKPEKPAKLSPAKPSKEANKPYFINVGLFSVPENAARANAKLLEAKLPSVVKELKSTKGRQIRVRVGPFASQEQAESAAKKIKALQLDASIIHP